MVTLKSVTLKFLQKYLIQFYIFLEPNILGVIRKNFIHFIF